MTTIACNQEEMAADTRVSTLDKDNGRVNTFPSVKVERIRDFLLGTSGDFQAGVRFFDWVRAGEKGRKPKLCKDFRGMKLTPKGIFVVDGDDLTWGKVDSGFFAIGSGAHYAIGAMEHGASPKIAVKTAMKWDAWSGGSVTVTPLVLPEKKSTGE